MSPADIKLLCNAHTRLELKAVALFIEIYALVASHDPHDKETTFNSIMHKAREFDTAVLDQMLAAARQKELA